MIAPDGTMILSEEQLEKIMDNFAQEDTAYNKTWTRIVVENILGKVRFVMFPFHFFLRIFDCAYFEAFSSNIVCEIDY